MTTAEPHFALVQNLLVTLSKIPYENLTKIVEQAQSPLLHLRTPELLTESHLAHNGGGTCFSLTFWLYQNLNEAGIKTKLVMGDKRIQSNIHCALLWQEGTNYWLLDPGYMIFEPLSIPTLGTWSYLPSGPNHIHLFRDSAHSVQLFTAQADGLNPKERFRFRLDGVLEAEFMHFWRESYTWEMMAYPVLNKLDGNSQIYLQKNNLVIRTPQHSERKVLTRYDMPAQVERYFGLSQNLVEEALQALDSKGCLRFFR
jgi:arylamine N-acetyltransferase